MTYLEILWSIFCTELVLLVAEVIYIIAVGLFGKSKDYEKYFD